MKRLVLFPVLLMVAIMSNLVYAKNNATFYMKDGTKKEAEFVGMENNIVTVKITMPDSSIVTKTFPKEKFEKIEKFDWEIVDLSQTDFPIKKSSSTPISAKNDTLKNISNVYPKAQPILKDTVKPANQPEIKKDIAPTLQSPENTDTDKIATLIEAGKYERKSISFINSLLCIDGSAKNTSSDDLKYT
ncbi:MAG: hypothetical protein WBM07_15800 [Chitinivibrionales bacterium]